MFWRKCDMLGTKQWSISPMHTHVFCTVSNTVTFEWASWAITITSNEHYVVSNRRSFDCLYNSLCGPTSNSHQSPDCWLFDAIVASIWTHPRKYIPLEFAWKPNDEYVYVWYVRTHTCINKGREITHTQWESERREGWKIERPRYFEL